MAQMDGPCRRANRCAKESGSALMMKLIWPCRYRVTFLCRCRAMAANPIVSNTWPNAAGSGAAYSMNSNPSVPIGLSHGANFMVASRLVPAQVVVAKTQADVAVRRELQIFAERLEKKIAECRKTPAAVRNTMPPRDQIRQ